MRAMRYKLYLDLIFLWNRITLNVWSDRKKPVKDHKDNRTLKGKAFYRKKNGVSMCKVEEALWHFFTLHQKIQVIGVNVVLLVYWAVMLKIGVEIYLFWPENNPCMLLNLGRQ